MGLMQDRAIWVVGMKCGTRVGKQSREVLQDTRDMREFAAQRCGRLMTRKSFSRAFSLVVCTAARVWPRRPRWIYEVAQPHLEIWMALLEHFTEAELKVLAGFTVRGASARII